jgi:putative 4-mercaptohistidine N1-methyltranferase
MSGAGYESDRLLAEYLLFHYGTPEEILPYAFGPREALGYPVRCVTECLAGASGTPPGCDASGNGGSGGVTPGYSPPPLRDEVRGGRALDLGCAVGRSTFELARHFGEVIGIDLSRKFIAAAQTLQREGRLAYERTDEGDLRTPLMARVPADIPRAQIDFEVGDAMELRADLGAFDVVLMANLIDRLGDPRRCLARLPDLVKPGGRLILSSPYTWLEDFTPREKWLAGEAGTLQALRDILAPDFEFLEARDLPFLIREHARKFQWSVAQASIWRRKA